MNKMLAILTKRGFSDHVADKADSISRELKKVKSRIDVVSELVKNMREDSTEPRKNNGF